MCLLCIERNETERERGAHEFAVAEESYERIPMQVAAAALAEVVHSRWRQRALKSSIGFARTCTNQSGADKVRPCVRGKNAGPTLSAKCVCQVKLQREGGQSAASGCLLCGIIGALAHTCGREARRNVCASSGTDLSHANEFQAACSCLPAAAARSIARCARETPYIFSQSIFRTLFPSCTLSSFLHKPPTLSSGTRAKAARRQPPFSSSSCACFTYVTPKFAPKSTRRQLFNFKLG